LKEVTGETLFSRAPEARFGRLRNHLTRPHVRVSHRKKIGPDKSEAFRGKARQGTSNYISRCALRMHRGLVRATIIKNCQW